MCGSAISMMYVFERERVGLTLGTINEADPPISGITYHMFLSEKASWYIVPDDVATRQAGFGDGFQAKVDKWKKEQGMASEQGSAK